MAPTQKAATHAEQVVDSSAGIWDSYVSELGRADGEFLGGGARALGLSGAPENGATWMLMNGINPVTGERFHTPYWTRSLASVTYGNKKKMGVPAFAAVIAAPKSVSLLLPTRFAGEAVDAHRAAVAETVRFIESQWFVRDRSGVQRTIGLIGTLYEHHTARSRVPEPHLHTHLSLMNFAQRASDGKWLAVDYKHFLKVQKAAGIVYQAALRRELALRIPGVEFDLHEDGTADIAQIPAEVRERFSTRHFEVIEKEAQLAAKGIRPGLKRMDYAGFETRTAKELIDPREWLSQQRDALAWLGITDESIEAWAGQDRGFVASSWEVRREDLADRLFGPEGLTEKSNTFNRWDVMERVGMAHYADMESFEQLVGRTDELLADPRVLAVGEQGRYTVCEIVELEQALLAMHRARPRAAARSGQRAIVRDMISEAEARQGWVFNDGQRAMIEGVATSENQLEIVQALAGTGKTRSLGVLAEILEAQGVRVIGVAPTGRARLELLGAGLRDARTYAKLKLQLECGEEKFEPRRPVVLLGDEAGFTGTRELAASLMPLMQAGGRAVLIGDSGQLGSVAAGGLFAAVSRERAQSDQGVYRLTEVRRQQTLRGRTDVVEVRALEALHGGAPAEWIALRETRGQLHMHTGPDAGADGIEHAAALYLSALERHQAEDLYLLAAENAVRAAVNERVREQLVDRGVIVEAGEIGGRRFAEGERLVLRENDNEKALANGMRATILEVDVENGTLTVAIDGANGGVVKLDHAYVTGRTENGQERVQGGYANTIHTSQGGTVNETIIVGPAQGLDNERGYVAASRARYATHVITWDGSAPEYFAEQELAVGEQQAEVRRLLADATARTGVEPSVTEQIGEAIEQLELDVGGRQEQDWQQEFVRDSEPAAATGSIPVEETGVSQKLEACEEHQPGAGEEQQPAARASLDRRERRVTPADARDLAAEPQASVPAGDVSHTPARDAFIDFINTAKAVRLELSEPWAQQASETHKLATGATRAREASARHQNVPEPPL